MSNTHQYTFYTEVKEEFSSMILNRHYDDQRRDYYIRLAKLKGLL